MPNGAVVVVSGLKKAHKRFLVAHDAALNQAFDEQRIEADVKQHIASGILLKMRSGNLLRSTRTRVVRTKGGLLARVQNTAKYAHAQESGSGLQGPSGQKYPIVPKGSGYPLHFFWARKGMWVSTYRVMHPGVHATHFLQIASDLTFLKRIALLRAGMRQAARHF